MYGELSHQIARALVERTEEWHQVRNGACHLDAEVAAGIAAEVAGRLVGGEELRDLRRRLERAERRIGELEAVPDAVRRAQVWDFALYDEVPDADWLAVDRERYTDVLHAITMFARWKPWRTVIARRLEPH